jgi:hypothetical protein
MGSGTTVQMPGGMAIGTDSAGMGAQSTLINQVTIGTGLHTYTTPGIVSDLSRMRQDGPVELVTSDAAGNLATDNGEFIKTLDEHTSGIALAMSMENPDLAGPETFGVAGNWAVYDGASALSVSAMGVVGYDLFMDGDRVAISGSMGFGFQHKSGDHVAGARVGVQWTR